MRILLVDDSSAYHEEFLMLLRDSGIQFSALDTALTAAEGARLIKAGVHDIYFIDYRLPAENGLTLVSMARRSGTVKPMIVLTAYDNPDVDAAAEAAGANDYLQKGQFLPETLNRSIRYALRNAASLEAATTAELRFAMAQEAAMIGTWEWNIGPDTFVWSDRQYANFGLDPKIAGPITYDIWRTAIHPDDRVFVDAALATAMASQSPLGVKFRVVTGKKDPGFPFGQVHWISAKGRVIRDGRGNPVKMVGVSIDITEQQSALNAVQDSRNLALAGLRVSETRFKAYFDSAPECLFLIRVKPDRTFVYDAINPAGLGYVGGTLDAIRDKTPEQVLGPQNGGIMVQGLRRVLETGSPYLYEPTFHIGATSIVYDAIYMPLFDDKGAVVSILGNARDITEKRRLESSLRQAQKMEALGQLASGVAHDFNNLLQGLQGCLDMLGKQVSSDHGKMLVVEGRRTVGRGKSLTDRLLAFSRQQPMTTQPVDFNGAIEEMTGLLTRTLDGVRVGKVLAPGLWMSMADRNQIELAILNLAINARDAMPVGGSFLIETSNERLGSLQEDGLPEGDYVSIRLADTGIGMAPETVARAVDPFFTTKPVGKGTGLGLSMVYGMVRQLGGGLRITSEVGKGTTITLLLPRAQADAEVAAPPAKLDITHPTSILLVDNDPDTQAAIRAYAADLGLTMVVAETGQEALALLAVGSAVEIVIADATLPGLSGPALLSQVKAQHPGVRSLLVSGLAASPNAIEADGLPMLAKPFDAAAFKSAVMTLLPNRPDATNVVEIRPEIHKHS